MTIYDDIKSFLVEHVQSRDYSGKYSWDDPSELDDWTRYGSCSLVSRYNGVHNVLKMTGTSSYCELDFSTSETSFRTYLIIHPNTSGYSAYNFFWDDTYIIYISVGFSYGNIRYNGIDTGINYTDQWYIIYIDYNGSTATWSFKIWTISGELLVDMSGLSVIDGDPVGLPPYRCRFVQQDASAYFDAVAWSFEDGYDFNVKTRTPGISASSGYVDDIRTILEVQNITEIRVPGIEIKKRDTTQLPHALYQGMVVYRKKHLIPLVLTCTTEEELALTQSRLENAFKENRISGYVYNNIVQNLDQSDNRMDRAWKIYNILELLEVS